MFESIYRFFKKILPTSKVNMLFFSALSTLVKVIVGFVTIKLFAVFIGPEGLALSGNIGNLISLLSTIAVLGINVGVVKYVAQYQNDESRLRLLISTGFKIVLYASGITSLIVFFLSGFLSQSILYSPKYQIIFIFLALALPLNMLNGFLSNILNGLKSLKYLAFINVCNGLFAIGFIVTLIQLWGMKGALAAMVLAPSISLIFTLIIIRKESWFSREFFFSSFDFPSFKLFLGFSLMAGISALLLPFTQFYIRNLIIERLSLADAGSWEALNKMSNSYLSVIIASFSVYYLPRLSELRSKKEIVNEIIHMAMLVLPLILVIQILIYLFREEFVLFLFSSKFAAINSLLFYQLIGDFFRVTSWLFAYVILARAYTKSYVFSETISAIFYLVASTLLLNVYGLRGVVVAYSFDFILYFTLLFMLLYFKFKRNHIF